MFASRSPSQFSSFQSQPQDQPYISPALPTYPTPSTPYTAKQKLFSQFSQSDQQRPSHHHNIQHTTTQIIKNLKQQIQALQYQNINLIKTNKQLNGQIELLKNRHREGVEGQLSVREQKNMDKIRMLSEQIGTIRHATGKLRQQSQIDQSQIQGLKNKLEQYKKKQGQWQWKEQFIGLFIDMLDKISQDFDKAWPEKKKIQVGWKIVKNIVDKAINSGIKPPRVEKTKSSITNR